MCQRKCCTFVMVNIMFGAFWIDYTVDIRCARKETYGQNTGKEQF